MLMLYKIYQIWEHCNPNFFAEPQICIYSVDKINFSQNVKKTGYIYIFIMILASKFLYDNF